MLLVEDEPTIAITLRDDLVADGFEVASAADADTAIRLLRERNFRAVITDYRLPGQNGFVVLQAAKRHGAHVMLISAWLGASDSDVRARGADAVLRKPFANERVLAWLRSIA